MTLKELLLENNRRKRIINTRFNPITGEGSVLERFPLRLDDHPTKIQHIPLSLKDNHFIISLAKAGSISNFLKTVGSLEANYDIDRDKVIQKLVQLRSKHDFCYWSFMFVYIKNKDGGDDIRFRLNRPQRRLVLELEKMRLAGSPIRLILLKARQWGGSTCIQIYMAWIQLMHKTGWNSIVVSHQMTSTTEVKGMFSKLMKHYPAWMLHSQGDSFKEDEKNLVSFEGSQSIDYIPQRNSKIKTGTALSPESARGGDTAMAHCTEVAFWSKTDNKTPEQIVRSACSGMLYAPLTLEVFESTANGTGNYFADEWDRAKREESDKKPLFISWFDIEKYSLPIDDINAFARELIDDRTTLGGNGKYNWFLWEKGATLEAINWYIHNRKRFNDHADMAAEYPSDDVEAFKHSGKKVFDIYKIEELAKSCKDPLFVGEVRGVADSGADALKNIVFNESKHGLLKVWEEPEICNIKNRYIVTVDVGGRSDSADYSVIHVLDRYWMMYDDKPCTVAQWCGHIRHDLLAWKSVQIATYYNKALLVIESNTLETNDRDRDTDGDHTEYILEQIADIYGNLYARESSAEDVVNGAPRKWGFHTNRKTKTTIIDNLIKEIEENSYVERDRDTIAEYKTYEKRQNGSYGAIAGKHDDKLMTRAISLHISSKMELPKEITKTPVLKRRNIGLESTI